MKMKEWCKNNDNVGEFLRDKPVSVPIYQQKNSILTGLKSNPCFRTARPATNLLIHGNVYLKQMYEVHQEANFAYCVLRFNANIGVIWGPG
jgi:hypothetical protein